jgi:hypothetical protein
MVFSTTATSFALFSNNVNDQDFRKVIVIISTDWKPYVSEISQPYIDTIYKSIIPTEDSSKVIIFRFCIHYNYSHDLNNFTRQLIESLLGEIGIPEEKLIVVTEEYW